MNNTFITIRILASLIGNFTAAFPAIPLGKFYYRNLERIKTRALINSKGDFDTKTEIPTEGITELEWWTNYIHAATRSAKIPDIDMTIYTDASDLGWGITNSTSSSGGRWSTQEKEKRTLMYENLKL